MKIFVLIRRNPETFFSGVQNFARQLTTLVWNNTFGMPYETFRDRLSQIALSRMYQWPVEGIIQYKNTKVLQDVLKMKDTIVVPVDDDDWLHPSLFRRLEEEGGEWDVAVWKTVYYRQFENTWEYKTGPNNDPSVEKLYWWIPSCGYAIKWMEDESDAYLHSVLTQRVRQQGRKVITLDDECYAWYNYLISSFSAASYVRANPQISVSHMQKMQNRMIAVANRTRKDFHINVPSRFLGRWWQLCELMDELRESITVQNPGYID